MATAFRLTFQGSQQVPPVLTKANGFGAVIYDATTSAATYFFTVNGIDFGDKYGSGDLTADLGDDASGLHVHSGAAGVNGGIVLDLFDSPPGDQDDFAATINADGSTSFSGVWETTDDDSITPFVGALNAAAPGDTVSLYFNIHTTDFGGGAIRAQWVCIADDDANIVNGTRRADNLPGLDGNDTINGKEGNDILDGGDGNDTLIGGKGFDTITYAAAASGVTINLALVTQQNIGGGELETIKQVEKVIGSIHDDTLTGNAGNNFFIGGVGGDTIDGGLGVDTVSYANSQTGVHAQISGFGVGGEAEGDFLTNIELIVGSDHVDEIDGTLGAQRFFGGLGEDHLIGYGGNDTLNGEDDNDTLDGVDGNDKLNGGDGDDTMIGGSGKDLINGGTGVDTAIYQLSAVGVTVNLGLPRKLLLEGQKSAGDAKGDKLLSIENLFGSSQNDKLTGNAGANSLDGGLGDDILNGGAGTDQLTGSNGNDTLNGGANNDNLNGGADNDILIGGTGNDTLFGGGNIDKFLFKETGTANADTINDYSGLASDELDFSALLNKPFNLATQQPEDFVQREIVGDDVVIKVDLNGLTAGANFVEVCTLDGYATASGETTVLIRFENQLFSLDVATGLFA